MVPPSPNVSSSGCARTAIKLSAISPPSAIPLPPTHLPRLRTERGQGERASTIRPLPVRPATHRVGLPADERCAREDARVDGRARPLALEDRGHLAPPAPPPLGRHPGRPPPHPRPPLYFLH